MQKAIQDYVSIARVTKTQGRRGEVGCAILTDFPEKFAERKSLSLWSLGRERREIVVEEHWFHKGMVVLKFAGVNSITEAEALVGMEVQVAEKERVALETGAYYISDLVGCVLFDRGVAVGLITDVDRSHGGAPLLVVKQHINQQDREIEVPFAEAYLAGVDVGAKEVRMKLPEGLLEINAGETGEKPG